MEKTTERAPVRSTDFGLYVHFPYCLRICPYCSFNVYSGQFDGTSYANAVIAELQNRFVDYQNFGPLRSIYFGGGTPSLWETGELDRIIRVATEIFGRGAESEITLECNPENLTADYLAQAKEYGINRISLGSQSLVQSELVQLGRQHRTEDTFHAIGLAHALGFSISVDLIFGLPGQTERQLEQTLVGLTDQPIDHISSYALTIEEGTSFDRQRRRGKFRPMSNDDQADRTEFVTRSLLAAGFEHYEVSAFGRGKHRAIHNSLYWVGAPYLGLGAGAGSYLPGPGQTRGRRRETIRDTVTYVESAQRALFPEEFEEVLSQMDLVIEGIMLGARVKWGFKLKDLDWGDNAAWKISQLLPVIDELSASGLIKHDQDHLWPTERGLMFADTIARKLVAKASELLE